MYTPPTIHQVNYAPPQNGMANRPSTEITDIIFHHTAGPLGQTAIEIDAEHRNEGWAMIGYNWLITPDGAIYAGRPPAYVPSAAYGRNTQSLNVCLVGNFEEGDPGYTGPPSEAQVIAATALSIWLHKQYPQVVRTIGHRDVATLFYPNDTGDYSTLCPGSKFMELLPQIKTATVQSMKPT